MGEGANVLGISGSPRKKGNTTYAVRYALDILNKEGFKTRFISLTNKKNPTLHWLLEV